MNQPQEGAESILDHSLPSKPTEPVNLTFWQTCKVHPWPAAVACLFLVALIGGIFWAASPTNPPAKRTVETAVTAAPVVAPEPMQTAEIPNQPQIIPKKIARKAINTPASGANLTVSDDVLGDFITELERKKANPLPKNKEPAPSASNLEQDFETRLFNFERKIP